jgi:Winged helix DNA-binding domain
MDLILYTDESGAVLHDLPGVDLADEDTPAPVRFLPTWDATLLAHCRRSGILSEEFRKVIFHTKIPQSVGTVLIDGSVAATWAWRNDRVEFDELAKLTPRQRQQIAAEADRLTSFYRA